uniref:GRIP domain-containing protein n=1 Tax=Amphora coffeiformis TaxID=265554 RepID=A0A7S3LEU0_9STRA|mmetsp:Transcript_8925/g.17068  ORF Transcript_8925/g.17068 Transcript_8925/m.17068 type:complete len:1122 (-) Transcript_8925:54-3419(-)
MWGFADLAKQAEEAAAAAAAAAQSASATSTSSWFNLDALQHTDEQKLKAEAAAQVKPPPPRETPVSTLPSVNFFSSPTAPPVAPPPQPKGKLQIPIKKPASPPAPKPAAAPASQTGPKSVVPVPPAAPAFPKTDEKVDTNQIAKTDEDIDVDHEDGWGGEDDLDMVDSTEADDDDEEEEGPKPAKPAETQKEAEQQQQVEKEVPVPEKSTDSKETSTEPGKTPESEETKDLLEETEENEDTPVVEKQIPEPEARKDDEEIPKQSPAEKMPVVKDAPPVEADPKEEPREVANAEQETPGAPNATLENGEESDKEKPQESPVTAGPQTNGSVLSETKAIVEEPAAKETEPTKKLLILCSIESLNRQATKRQENAFTILKARHLAYEMIDATDPVNQTWREELFQLAGDLREYPLFFLLDLSDGETTFWGNFERFEYSNDHGSLLDELTGKKTTPWDPTMFVEPEVAKPAANGGLPSTPKSQKSAADKEEMMKMFSEQLKRVEENHQAELAEMEKRHAQEIKNAVASVTHDACIAERKNAEEKLTAEIQKKHERLSDVLKSNEGYKLKIDVLKREVAGMQQLLENRDSNLGKASAVHKRDIKVLQEQLLEREEKASRAKQEAEKAEAAKKAMSEELERIRREHKELQDRATNIATELKQRRAECSNLRSKVDELTENNEKMEHSIENLTLQLSNHNITKSEKDGEMGRLRVELDQANAKISQLQTEMQTKEAAAEKALNDYKKKAQNSLAMANSRTASAVEAKEEAELEARAARSTADSAMDRAVKAEISSKEAVAEAKAYVAEMEKSTAKAKSDLAKATTDMETFSAKAEELQKELDALVGEKNKLVTDLAHAQGRFEEEQGRCRSLKDECNRFKQQAHTAREEVGKLRQQVRRLEQSKSDVEESSKQTHTHEHSMATERDDATISMLQRQLREANDVIEDLKAALNNAAETQEANQHTESHESETNGSQGSIPLFYAMEKQAELKTAQNEINRLANLLADVQSEKMEAIEAKEEMRQYMEDAQAKLQRYQKLSSTSPGEEQKGLEPMPKDSGATNIEYLKNIMMRYLHAKTIAEKKALIPVIAAVLCLTPEEVQGAIKTLDESKSIGAVGNTLFESISGRFM